MLTYLTVIRQVGYDLLGPSGCQAPGLVES